MKSAFIRTCMPGLLAGMMLLVMTVAAPAAEPPGAAAAKPGSPDSSLTVSKETRDKLAAMHEQMAACLRSEKTFAECRTEMRTACRETMNNVGCPSMGMGHGAGMGRRSMMSPPPATPDNGK